MVAKSKEPSEADIISNRINVRHADKLRLIASWLPAPTADELSNAKSEAQLEQEEKDMFAPVPELLGVGAAPPKDVPDGILRRKDTSSLEALRRQLLGRNAKKELPAKGSIQGPGKALADRTTKPPLDADSDDEGGRTAAFISRTQKSQGKTASKKKVAVEASEEADLDSAHDEEDTQLKGSSSRPAAPAPSKRKASSYLDEILAEKSKKKKKKQKKGTGAAKP